MSKPRYIVLFLEEILQKFLGRKCVRIFFSCLWFKINISGKNHCKSYMDTTNCSYGNSDMVLKHYSRVLTSPSGLSRRKKWMLSLLWLTKWRCACFLKMNIGTLKIGFEIPLHRCPQTTQLNLPLHLQKISPKQASLSDYFDKQLCTMVVKFDRCVLFLLSVCACFFWVWHVEQKKISRVCR